MGESQAIYIIGFSSSQLQLAPAAHWLRIAGVQSFDAGTLRCWYRPIDRSEFDGPHAEANLSNLEWLTPRALAHDAAVSAISASGSLYPARFGTLFTSLVPVRGLMERNETLLHSFLELINGRSEWGVKLFVNWQKARELNAVRMGSNSSDGSPSGTAYLQARKQARDNEVATKRWVQDCIEQLVTDLNSIGSQSNQLQIPKRSDPQENELECCCNVAILGDQRQSEQLRNCCKSFENEHSFCELQLTGPWPVYSFVPTLQSCEELRFA